MSEYCKNCFELAEKLTKKERECNTLKSQLDFAVRQKERFEQQCEALKSEGFTRESLITEQENEIDELKHENEELNGKYKNVLDLAKQNADANEYCLQELEQENIRYCKALEEIKEVLKDEICKECPGEEGCKGGCKEHQCLNIINKVKGEMDEQKRTI